MIEKYKLELLTADKKGIDELFINFNNAWAKGDAEAYSQLFWEDAKFNGAPGFRFNGRSEIKKEHQEMFETMFKHSTIDGKYEMETQALTNEVVLIHTLGNLFFPSQSIAKSSPTGLVTFCLVKRDGIWKIVLFQNTPTGNFRHLKFMWRFLRFRVFLLFSNKNSNPNHQLN
jgi:uncharacterized protein (TIGR02246 family)